MAQNQRIQIDECVLILVTFWELFLRSIFKNVQERNNLDFSVKLVSIVNLWVFVTDAASDLKKKFYYSDKHLEPSNLLIQVAPAVT